jgi:hypothetical protein
VGVVRVLPAVAGRRLVGTDRSCCVEVVVMDDVVMDGGEEGRNSKEEEDARKAREGFVVIRNTNEDGKLIQRRKACILYAAKKDSRMRAPMISNRKDRKPNLYLSSSLDSTS